MLTRCSAPTFMEMHPLIYPASPACSRLCLTSVLREVYYPARPLSPPRSSFLLIPRLCFLLRLLFLPFPLSSWPTLAATNPRPRATVLASSPTPENHSNVISGEDRTVSFEGDESRDFARDDLPESYFFEGEAIIREAEER